MANISTWFITKLIYNNYMRIIFLLLELLIFLAITSSIVYASYKISLNKKSKIIKKEFLNKKENRYFIDTDNFADDFEDIINFYFEKLPYKSQQNLNLILKNLNHIEAKSLKNSDLLNNKIKQQLADIIYKMTPEFLEQYVQIPKHLLSKYKNNNGKNPNQLIDDNTTILALAVAKITDELFAENITKMSSQQKYANQKFNIYKELNSWYYNLNQVLLQKNFSTNKTKI